MLLKKILTSAVLAAILSATPGMAAELVFPSLDYRTGPYAVSGVPFSDGYADYFTLLNERDGGIGGVPVKVLPCETGYNTEKGVECYESTKGQGALLYQPLSTGISYQLIPRASVDGIPLHTMGYGRTSAANGKIFPMVFNYPANYWNAASGAINHILQLNDGNIQGKKVALLYHNSAYGKEPIRTLEKLAEKHGYELSLLPVDHPGQEQKSQWLQIRRERPDYVLMWGWGVMNPTAIQEAANIRFPMANFIGNWWAGSEGDVMPVGDAAHGYKSLSMHNTGRDFPLYDDIQKYVVGRDKAAGTGTHLGSVLYNRGVYAAVLAAEAVKKAQALHKTKNITPMMMRDGMEALDINEALMASLGLPNFGPPFTVSCENHGGQGFVGVQQWDAHNGSWQLIADFAGTDDDVVLPLIMEDSMAYAAENNIKESCQ